jgi:predicted Zn-dependent peptidase
VGFFSASSSVKAGVTGAAVREFLKEIEGIRGGDVRADETAKARATLRTDVIQSFAGLHGLLAEAVERTAAGQPLETLGQDMARLESVTAEQLNKLAGPAMPLEEGVLVLVGDKNTIHEQIKDLGLPPAIELSVRGDPVGGK